MAFFLVESCELRVPSSKLRSLVIKASFRLVLLLTVIACAAPVLAGAGFVTVRGHVLERDGAPYYFVGANYWYGGLLPLERDPKRGIERLRRELDFLRAHGITNLRLMAGAEGVGELNGVTRVGPSLQPFQGTFNERVLDGLDRVLYEMGKRRMTAVIFLSNNWEWSGGFQQYLIWNGVIPDKWLRAKPTWDELRDSVAKFYSCTPCMEAYNAQVKLVLSRKNKYTGKQYTEDPAIMAWELANEPRPMRPGANDDYRWISAAAAMIKSIDRRHLVTIGHEGWIGAESNATFKDIHSDPNVDYLTIHIWPKNWGWFASGHMRDDYANLKENTRAYLAMHIADAAMLDKPLVVEEFGLPRDEQLFDPSSTTGRRDAYFEYILSYIKTSQHVAGANFWAFGGTARPHARQTFWKIGDDLMGDPPMEEQGLNSVFDSDRSTWTVIERAARKMRLRG